MKYKQNNAARKRNKSLGIKLSENEVVIFNDICKSLGITKLEFLLQAMEQYKELII